MNKKLKGILSIMATCLLSASLLTGCSSGTKTEDKKAEEKVTLRFMYFGTLVEKDAVSNMVKEFEKTHTNIKIEPIHVPDDQYNTKMATLVAGGQEPDVAYCSIEQAYEWFQSGKIMDLSPYFEKDKNAAVNRMETSKYYVGNKLMATNTAMETMTLYYSREAFKKAGLPEPPSTLDKAWKWDEFVEVAKKLTIDNNGKNASEPGFDYENIKQYGVSFGTGWYSYLSFVFSNGGDLASPDGKTPTVDSPEFIDAVQKMADLIHKYHVAPSPAQKKTMPGLDITLQTGQIAMTFGGQWSLLDLGNSKVNFGIGVLPVLKQPAMVGFGDPTVIFSSTKHPQEAWEFYKFHNSVATATSLFANGLWMPTENEYYEKPELLDKWIKNDAHPKEYKTAVVDAFFKVGKQAPTYTLKNFGKINDKMTAKLDLVWQGKEPAEKVLKELNEELKPMMQGRWKE